MSKPKRTPCIALIAAFSLVVSSASAVDTDQTARAVTQLFAPSVLLETPWPLPPPKKPRPMVIPLPVAPFVIHKSLQLWDSFWFRHLQEIANVAAKRTFE